MIKTSAALGLTLSAALWIIEESSRHLLSRKEHDHWNVECVLGKCGIENTEDIVIEIDFPNVIQMTSLVPAHGLKVFDLNIWYQDPNDAPDANDAPDPHDPNFDKLIGRTAYRGKIPKDLAEGYQPPYDGLLNTDQAYYWRVRSRDARCVWSPWSKVIRFTPLGPGVPIGLKLGVDRAARTARLRWRPNPKGRLPTHYEIYGSDERGFSPSREPYDVVIGGNKSKRFDANLIAAVKDTTLQVIGPTLDDAKFNKVYYRVVAVDSHGVRSGPTTFVEAPHPMFVSRPAIATRVREPLTYKPRVSRSIGHLVGYTADNTPYNFEFRWGDDLTFSIRHGPDWLKLDVKTGLLTGTPPASAKGSSEAELHVISKLGGRDRQRFELQVRP